MTDRRDKRRRRRPASAGRAATHAAYAAALRAGVLRYGRAVRTGHRHPDERAEAQRRACRGRAGDDE